MVEYRDLNGRSLIQFHIENWKQKGLSDVTDEVNATLAEKNYTGFSIAGLVEGEEAKALFTPNFVAIHDLSHLILSSIDEDCQLTRTSERKADAITVAISFLIHDYLNGTNLISGLDDYLQRYKGRYPISDYPAVHEIQECTLLAKCFIDAVSEYNTLTEKHNHLIRVDLSNLPNMTSNAFLWCMCRASEKATEKDGKPRKLNLREFDDWIDKLHAVLPKNIFISAYPSNPITMNP